MCKDIKEILEFQPYEIKLDKEFSKTLIRTIKKELKDKNYDDDIINDYIYEIQTYMNEEEIIKDKIIETVIKLIDNNKNEGANYKDIIDEIYKNSYINKYTVDINSCLFEYIKNNIFNAYIKKILLKLEDNNILTTLIELKKQNNKIIDKRFVEEIIEKYIDEINIKTNETKPEAKFLFNYNVPGLYNFFKDFSNYINKNIIPNYFNNEKKLREALIFDVEKICLFHDKENSLLNKANNYISYNKFISLITYKNI